MGWIAGLDIGSSSSKAVLMQDNTLVAHSILTTEGHFSNAADAVLNAVLDAANLRPNNLDLIGASGLGAAFIPYPSKKISDIACHSRGANFYQPSARTLIEIGNQLSRVIKITPQGRVAGCTTGDKCAAGSGRILQIVARVLQVKLEDLGPISMASKQPAKFTTGCAVFLETEAVSRVAEGIPIEDIIAGLHQALANKIAVMAHKMKVEEDCAIIGGGALNIGLVKIVEEKIQKRLFIPEEPLLSGAVGAALIAAERSAED
ncbi:MAG: acyl-CoA dehydratase activase [Desulfobacterales bacterium]